jgi:hypothetical protein
MVEACEPDKSKTPDPIPSIKPPPVEDRISWVELGIIIGVGTLLITAAIFVK